MKTVTTNRRCKARHVISDSTKGDYGLCVQDSVHTTWCILSLFNVCRSRSLLDDGSSNLAAHKKIQFRC